MKAQVSLSPNFEGMGERRRRILGESKRASVRLDLLFRVRRQKTFEKGGDHHQLEGEQEEEIIIIE